MKDRSNDDLARLLYQNGAAQKSSARGAPQPANDPMAPRKIADVIHQAWTLGAPKTDDGPMSEQEQRALFAALTRGTKAILGREPTALELLSLRDQVNSARALLKSIDDAMHGRVAVYLEHGLPAFSDLPRSGMSQDGGKAA